MVVRRLSHVALVLFMSLLVHPAVSKTLGLNRINTVRLTQRGQATIVEIAGERAPNFTTFKQMAPRRVIVDVAECDLNGVPRSIEGDGKLVEKITTAKYGRAPHLMSRVVIRLAQEAEYKVTIRGGSLFVHLAPGAGGLLVSAGVPVGPDRKLRKKAVALQAKSPRDRALSEELAEPRPRVEDLGAPQEALHVGSVAVPDPGADAGWEGDEAEPDLALVAAPTPQPSRSPLHKPKPRPVSMPAAPESGPDSEADTDSPREVAYTPSPSPASIDAPVPKEPKPAPVVEEPQPAPVPPEPAEPVEVARAQEEEVPVEVVEEVQEVNEAPEDEYVPPPPPPPEESEAPPPPEEYTAPAPAEERVEISSAIKNMTWLGFQQTRDSSRVFIKTNAPVQFHVVEEGRNLIVLELENTRIPLRNNQRFLDTHWFDTAVTMIVPREIEGISRNVRVEIQLKNRVPYTTGQEGNLVYVNFQRPR
jgi:colicin import membrane protein